MQRYSSHWENFMCNIGSLEDTHHFLGKEGCLSPILKVGWHKLDLIPDPFLVAGSHQQFTLDFPSGSSELSLRSVFSKDSVTTATESVENTRYATYKHENIPTNPQTEGGDWVRWRQLCCETFILRVATDQIWDTEQFTELKLQKKYRISFPPTEPVTEQIWRFTEIIQNFPSTYSTVYRIFF